MTARNLFPFRCLLALGVTLAGAAGARAQLEVRNAPFNRLYAPLVVPSATAALAGVSLAEGGTGYTGVPTVTISGGGGSGATATATISGGVVTGFTLTNPGAGYTSPPTIAISGGGGANAKAVAVFRAVPSGASPAATAPQFAALAGHNGGSAARSTSATLSARYPAQIYLLANSATPSGTALIVVRSGVGGSFATGVARYSLGDVIAPPATQDGAAGVAAADYWRREPVKIGETFAQSATSTTDTPLALVLTEIKVDNGGSGYLSAPTVVFSGGGGSGAAATAEVQQGSVTAITLTDAGSGYTALPAITFSGGGGSGATAAAVANMLPFYYSPHAQRVFATQAGRVVITWVSSAPVASGTGADAVLKYRFKQESFTVSSAATKPSRTIFWTERTFNGPVVSIPQGKIEHVNPVYNLYFPASVAKEYQPVGFTPLPSGSAVSPPERRTLWFESVGGVAQLRAYNREGRLFVEYLGQAMGAGETRVFLGADIVEVVRVPTPVETTVNLGDQLTPRDVSDTILLPGNGGAEWIASEVVATGANHQTFYGSLVRRDGGSNYYAERENLVPERVAFYWLEKADAAIHFYAASTAPNLGLAWPRQRSHYKQVWPADLAKYAHHTVPAGGSTPATGLQFTGGQVPQLIFQDDPAGAEARIDSATQRLLVTFDPKSPDGLNRSLLKFSDASEVWYVRLFTQMESRPRTIAVTNQGSGYTSAPTVSFTNGGTNATATANLADGRVTSITLTNPGKNFTSATQVVIAGGGGSGAAALVNERGYQEGDGSPAIIADVNVGDRLNAPAGYEPGGYIASGDGYLPAAYADPFAAGHAAAARGAIIPVNAVPTKNVLTVWWFRQVPPPSSVFQPLYVPAKIGTYRVAYPSNPPTIVLASNAGSGDLSGAEIAGSLYYQNDRTKPGFNPNEEHALLIAGRVYALRDDLNNTNPANNGADYTSEPFALLHYKHPTDARPAMRIFKILRELDVDGTADDKLFNYPVTAGTMLQGPMPLPLLPLPLDNSTPPRSRNTEVPNISISDNAPFRTGPNAAPDSYDNFIFEDRKGYKWVYRGPHGAAPVNSVAIANAGSGYTSAPTVTIASPPSGGTQATATATISGGRIVAITVNGNGSGYTSAPAITFSGGGGTGASAVANIGPTLGMQFYYPMREGFFVPGSATQPAVGTILPYLRPLASGAPQGHPVSGTPLTIVYRPVWPDNAAELRIAETLALPKFGLPAIYTQTSANVLYQQSIAVNGTTKPSVTLHDPIREKTYAFGTDTVLDKIPGSVLTSDYQGKTYFQRVPPHLQNRLFYDPNRGPKGALVFLGKFVDEIAGEDYVSLNVLSPGDVTTLKALCLDGDTNKTKWDAAIDGLTTKVETFIPDELRPGAFKPRTSQPTDTVTVSQLATITDSDTAVAKYALTATGAGSGWVSLIFGNGQAFTPKGEPVSVAVFKVARRLHTGELKVELSSNPLDEQTSLRHSGDFAARPDDYDFEWRYAPPQDGVAPPIYTYTMAQVAPPQAAASVTWQFAANPAGALPTDSEYSATPVSLPYTLAIRTEAARAVTQPGRVAKMTGGLDFSAGIPGRIVFSTDLTDANAGFVLYVNGAAAVAYQAPAPFTNAAGGTGLVASGLARQFELDGNAFKAGLNTVEVALFTASAINVGGTLAFRFDVSTETDLVANSTTWQTPNGTLSNQIVVGGSPTAPLGSPLLVMSDNYFTLRYRPKASTNNVAGTAWSRWMPAKLVEGWIKRALAGINPFNQRHGNLNNHAVNTDVSLLTQAGKRWEGDVSLNLENIDQFGLIEIYETILNRAKNISIDAGYDYAPANDALLLAAGYLHDLYTILGNEAYADAANPTIAVDSRNIDEINTSRFSFSGQVKDQLAEELALLRGRDDFLSPGVTKAPAYNRLFWNFTRGIDAGQALYAINYGIREKHGGPAENGRIDAADAQRMFPQGHGDAYGHYLTALKGYTRLLQNPNFTWTPRTEAVTLLGQAVQVDYFDERKFAQTAIDLARTAQEIIALTHRANHREDPAAGWLHFEDAKVNSNTGVTRYWGLGDWVARATQGAYFNWVLGNAILPDVDVNPQHTGIQLIDRTTVLELQELPTFATAFQTKLDTANGRLNPLGLNPDTIPFDISSSELKAGKSHYEQIQARALQAALNAKGAFDQAAKLTRGLRNQQHQTDDFNDSVVDQERAYTQQLITLYGRPYPGEIGPGRIYAQGYTGPDFYQWFVVDRPAVFIDTSVAVPVKLQVPTGVKSFSAVATWSNEKDKTAPIDVSNEILDYFKKYKGTDTPSPSGFTTRTFTVQPNRYTQFSDTWDTATMGKRAVTGTIQMALLDADRARVDFNAAYVSLQHRIQEVSDQFGLMGMVIEANKTYLLKKASIDSDTNIMGKTVTVLKGVTEAIDVVLKYKEKLKEVVIAGQPMSVGLANDPSFLTRSAVAAAALVGTSQLQVTKFTTSKTTLVLEAVIKGLKEQLDDLENLNKLRYEENQVVLEAEQSLRSLLTSVYEIAQLATNVQRADEAVRNVLAEGDRLQAERELFRRRAAAKVQGYRIGDVTFRVFRDEALEQYRTLFDLAARYTYLAAKSYDYETGLLGSPAGESVLNAIVAARALGDFNGGLPQATSSVHGDPGLAGDLARLQADWAVVKPRLGINNPDVNGTLFSLRRELFRLLPDASGDTAWQQTLEQRIMSDVMADSDVAAACLNLKKPDGSAVPGIVIPFSSTIQHGYNFFGLPSAAGDHNFSPSNFATKIYSVGLIFRGYIGMDPYTQNTPNAGSPNTTAANALNATPYAYLIPVGTDSLRAPPLGDTSAIRTFNVHDQALPLPFNLGATAFSATQFFTANGTLSEEPWIQRKHQAFRPVYDPAFFYGTVPAEFTSSRLVGRSVWNNRWKIVIPAYSLLNSETDGLNRFVASVKDIEIFLRTYSHAGN